MNAASSCCESASRGKSRASTAGREDVNGETTERRALSFKS